MALDATERLANAVSNGAELAPSIAVNDAGTFAIAWHVGHDLYVRNFTADGTAFTADIQVDRGLANAFGASVGIDSTGRTAVVYRTDGLLGIDAGIWGRTFNSNGTERHTWSLISSGSTETAASIAMDRDGNFVVVYESSGDGDGTGVFVRHYDANFHVLGTAYQVNVTTTGNQNMPSVAMIDLKNYVVVWSGRGTGDTDGVFNRQFCLVLPVLDLEVNDSFGGTGSSDNSNGFIAQPLTTTTTTSKSSVSTTKTSNSATTSNQANNGNSASVSITSGAGTASNSSTIRGANSPASGVPSSPDDSVENEDDKIPEVLPTNAPEGNNRIGDVAVVTSSTDSGRVADNGFVRRTYTITQRFDYDQVFNTSNSDEEIMHLDAQRELLYRRLSERVVEQSESGAEQLKNHTNFKSRVFGSVGVVATGFSVGYLFWAIRGGMLVSGLLAQIPAWTMLDPLLVIDGDQKEEDKESLQNLIDRQQAKMNRNEDTADNPVSSVGKLEA